MTTDATWREAGYTLDKGISACSPDAGESPTEALTKIELGAAMLKELLPHQPAEYREKLGEHLSVAITSGKPDAVATLVRLGADLELRGQNGLTPLQQATFTGRADVVQILIDAGAQLDARIGTGPHGPGTALHLAVARHSVPALSTLLAAGSKINAVENDRTQNTALHLAAQCALTSKGATETQKLVAADLVTALVDAGADASRRNRAGKFPLLLAIASGNRHAYTNLFDAGGYSGDELFEAVDAAIQHNAPVAIEAAFALGADISRKATVMGKSLSLVEYAQKLGATEIVKLLNWLAAPKDATSEAEGSERSSMRSTPTLDSEGPL